MEDIREFEVAFDEQKEAMMQNEIDNKKENGYHNSKWRNCYCENCLRESEKVAREQMIAPF